MHLGFTGTQVGLTQEQARRLAHVLQEVLTTHHEVIFHHGDCIGADMQAHALFHDLAIDMQAPSGIVIHPPDNREKRAFADRVRHGSYARIPITLRAEFPYLTRNQHIVDETEMLVACPQGHAEALRSGTWATARAARKAGKRVYVVYPDGGFNSDWV
jgi:hypothetical protein